MALNGAVEWHNLKNGVKPKEPNTEEANPAEAAKSLAAFLRSKARKD